jgi:hypothetical protein
MSPTPLPIHPCQSHDPGRRRFLTGLAAGVVGPPISQLFAAPGTPSNQSFRTEAESLLRDWGEAMLKQQVLDPSHPELHGSLRCPACNRTHGRCGDAILPLLAMAAHSGDPRYREAALALWGWMKNVDAPDGAWTNEPDPTSWKGTTVFSAIALVEALEWHGKLLDEAILTAIRTRLRRAGEFIAKTITPEYGNINYAAAGAQALSALGRLLDEPAFGKRARLLAHQVLGFFSPTDRLLFGEGKPRDQRSPKGCYPVDLGYNVSESLPSLIHYALTESDSEVLDAAVRSWRTHLEFMLPDGGWDNSWGTRSYKWSYWGSRTADGCQSALVRLATTDPVFGTAAWRNLRLLRVCTHDGLLHGGPHYADHGVPPCVHHTFVQAKAVAGALHHLQAIPVAPETAPNPAQAVAVRHFPELDVRLVTAGPWRASFSGYDWFYRPDLRQATGGTPGILWHALLGPVLAAGLAEYLPIEEHNSQPLPAGCAEPVSCRVEIRASNGDVFSNLFDGAATLRHEVGASGLRVVVATRLLSRTGAMPAAGPCLTEIEYALAADAFTITVRPRFPEEVEWALVVPVISRAKEQAAPAGDRQWEIRKPGGTLLVSASQPMQRGNPPADRAFSLCPGFQVLPLKIPARGSAAVTCKLALRM